MLRGGTRSVPEDNTCLGKIRVAVRRSRIEEMQEYSFQCLLTKSAVSHAASTECTPEDSAEFPIINARTPRRAAIKVIKTCYCNYLPVTPSVLMSSPSFSGAVALPVK